MRKRMRLSGAVGFLTFAAVLVAVMSGGAVGASSGGAFHVLGTSNGAGGGGKVLLTGAIGDHGHSASVNKNGKANGNGNYVLLTLTKGKILLNKTVLDNNIGKSFTTAQPNAATCSLQVSGSGKLPVLSGTGAYKGISGSAHITVSFGFILPRTSSGQCANPNNVNPSAALQLVYGGGTVSYH